MIAALLTLLMFAAAPKHTAVLSWTWQQGGAAPANGFHVWRAGFLKAPAAVATIPVTERSWTDSNVQNGRAYIYFVTAYNQAGESHASPERWVVIPNK